MSRSNQILGRILLGSAIGGLLGLVLLAMGIAVVLNAMSGRSNPASARVEIETLDAYEGPHDDGYDDEAYDPMGPAYPGEGDSPPPLVVPRAAEPLPPSSRGQWRSIFEEEAPVAPSAPTPPAAPTARPAPRPTPRNQPQPNRDEESLFY
jgi:hypothetical protein